MAVIHFLYSVVFVVSVFAFFPYAQAQTTSIPKPAKIDMPSEIYITDADCSTLNISCATCLSNPKCLWCPTSSINSCIIYPLGGKILPPSHVCSLDDARWGVCWVNYKILVIVMSCLGGIILLSIIWWLISCCCCCRDNKENASIRLKEEENNIDSETKERKAKSVDRKQRETKYDEIRKKYDIKKVDNNYQRFDEQTA